MSKLFTLFNVGSVPRFFKMVKNFGGIKACLYRIYRMDGLKEGELVGIDKFGNKYYENKSFFYGSSRWVEYAPYYALEYDASQIPVEWFGWMHYKTDYLPHCDKSRPHYKWMMEHTENLSGTPGQFYPYSTTKAKIHAWVPPKDVKRDKSVCTRLTSSSH